MGFGERTRRRYFFCHVGAVRARSLRPAISCGGRFAQASNASQFLAGMVTIRRSRMSASAASSALRRTKSLKLVRDNADAASSRARSFSLTRTLSTKVVMGAAPGWRMTIAYIGAADNACDRERFVCALGDLMRHSPAPDDHFMQNRTMSHH